MLQRIGIHEEVGVANPIGHSVTAARCLVDVFQVQLLLRQLECVLTVDQNQAALLDTGGGKFHLFAVGSLFGGRRGEGRGACCRIRRCSRCFVCTALLGCRGNSGVLGRVVLAPGAATHAQQDDQDNDENQRNNHNSDAVIAHLAPLGMASASFLCRLFRSIAHGYRFLSFFKHVSIIP